MILTPPKRHRHEILDDPAVDPAVMCRSMRDVAVANRLFGGLRAATREVEHAVEQIGRTITLLDVGAGLGDISSRVRTDAEGKGVHLRTIVLDSAFPLVRLARREADDAICADALALPLSDGSVDVVLCSQILHHFRQPEGLAFIREMHRVARHRVIIADLRRSWIAAAGLWLASFPLLFHSVSRHDGVVSILRGFTPHELEELVTEAVGCVPRVATHPLFRITATWSPA
jgi:2-polyprenyl-3-methyl-5-hydroxy-6-metoxy-1,4-benzoquinol methylase